MAVAWEASYIDGVLVDPRSRQPSEAKVCDGNGGTTITIEDLYYNTLTRLQALHNTSEEYSRILDVITKYTIQNSKVSFACKKSSSTSPDIATPGSMTVLQAVRLLYGHSSATRLLETGASSDKPKGRSGDEENSDETMSVDLPASTTSWSAEMSFSNANYQAKKMIFLLFTKVAAQRLGPSHLQS